jgi:hypothetical protein
MPTLFYKSDTLFLAAKRAVTVSCSCAGLSQRYQRHHDAKQCACSTRACRTRRRWRWLLSLAVCRHVPREDRS